MLDTLSHIAYNVIHTYLPIKIKFARLEKEADPTV